MDVELESIGSRSTAKIERGKRVFRPERASAAMREHERMGVRKKGHRVAWVA